MRTITKKCLLLFAMLLLLAVAVACGAANDADDADSAKSKKKTETEGKADPSDDEEAESEDEKTKSAIRVILDGPKNDAYLTMELNGNKINFAQDWDKVCEDLAKNNLLVSSTARLCVFTWDEESEKLQSHGIASWCEKPIPTDGLLFIAFPGSSNDIKAYDETTQSYREIPHSCQEYAFISALATEKRDLFGVKDLSFLTSDGITEKNTWDDVLKIKGGLEGSWTIYQNYLFRNEDADAPLPIHETVPYSNLIPGELLLTDHFNNPYTTYTVIYEDGRQVELNATQFEKDFDRCFNNEKSLQDYYDLYPGLKVGNFTNDMEWDEYMASIRREILLKDFWNWVTELSRPFSKNQLFQTIALNTSLEKFRNGEIKELAVVTYVTCSDKTDTSWIDKDNIGVDILYLYATE